MGFGSPSAPGSKPWQEPVLVHDRNKSLCLEIPRDHQFLLQNSRFHTHGWHAYGDVSITLSKSPLESRCMWVGMPVKAMNQLEQLLTFQWLAACSWWANRSCSSVSLYKTAHGNSPERHLKCGGFLWNIFSTTVPVKRSIPNCQYVWIRGFGWLIDWVGV